MPVLARAERAFVEQHPELPPDFHDRFAAVLARPASRGLTGRLQRAIPLGLPWLGPRAWVSAKERAAREVAQAYLAAWELARGARGMAGENKASPLGDAIRRRAELSGVGNLRRHTARGTLVNAAYFVGLYSLGLIKGFLVAAFLTRTDYGLWGVPRSGWARSCGSSRSGSATSTSSRTSPTRSSHSRRRSRSS